MSAAEALRTCRECGCIDERACVCEQPHRQGVCHWVEADLCSACAGLSLEESFTWSYWEEGGQE